MGFVACSSAPDREPRGDRNRLEPPRQTRVQPPATRLPANAGQPYRAPPSTDRRRARRSGRRGRRRGRRRILGVRRRSRATRRLADRSIPPARSAPRTTERSRSARTRRASTRSTARRVAEQRDATRARAAAAEDATRRRDEDDASTQPPVGEDQTHAAPGLVGPRTSRAWPDVDTSRHTPSAPSVSRGRVVAPARRQPFAASRDDTRTLIPDPRVRSRAPAVIERRLLERRHTRVFVSSSAAVDHFRETLFGWVVAAEGPTDRTPNDNPRAPRRRISSVVVLVVISVEHPLLRVRSVEPASIVSPTFRPSARPRTRPRQPASLSQSSHLALYSSILSLISSLDVSMMMFWMEMGSSAYSSY